MLGRESSVRGTRFYNGERVAEVAVQGVGLEIERRQERVFRNRYGADIYEDILHFRTTEELPDDDACLRAARRIAGQVLSAARGLVPDMERPGLEDAMACLDEIAPSPVAAPGAFFPAVGCWPPMSRSTPYDDWRNIRRPHGAS